MLRMTAFCRVLNGTTCPGAAAIGAGAGAGVRGAGGAAGVKVGVGADGVVAGCLTLPTADSMSSATMRP